MRLEKEKEIASGSKEINVNPQAVLSADNSSESDSDVSDKSDFNGSFKETAKKPKEVLLSVPTNILQQTALCNARGGVSARVQTMNIAEIIVKSGGNLKDFKISKSSANRYRNNEGARKAEEIKETFSERLEEIGRQFWVHFDGKLVQDLTPVCSMQTPHH